MGQQQLLLLVFGIVLVGGIVVAGAYAVDGKKQQDSRSIVFQEALGIVHDLQLWKRKPTVVRGGAQVHGFQRVHFGTLGYRHTFLSNRVYKTDVGCYILQNVGPDYHMQLTLYAPSCAQRDYVARVIVGGPRPNDLDWSR